MTENFESSSHTRSSLLARVRVNDQAAWHELVALYAPLIGRWCHRFGLQSAAIADVSQEVFLAVSRRIAVFQPTKEAESFRSWLWRITRHKIIDRQRSAAQRSLATGGSEAFSMLQRVADHQELPEDIPLDSQATNQLVSRALEQVRVEFQAKTWQAFWRTAVDGLSTEAVAIELQMTNAAVRQARSRISRRLRRQLGDII